MNYRVVQSAIEGCWPFDNKLQQPGDPDFFVVRIVPCSAIFRQIRQNWR
jgi:hypothetical protein